jgi:hypothetical protein
VCSAIIFFTILLWQKMKGNKNQMLYVIYEKYCFFTKRKLINTKFILWCSLCKIHRYVASLSTIHCRRLLESLCRSSNSSFLKLFLSYSRRRLTESDTIHSKNKLRKSLRAFSGQLIAELIFQNWQVYSRVCPGRFILSIFATFIFWACPLKQIFQLFTG